MTADTDLASTERYEDVLQGIVASTMRAVGSRDALLALRPRTGGTRTIFSAGLTESEAAAIAGRLLDGDGGGDDHVVVEVTSARRHYGLLCVGGDGRALPAQSHGALETYSQLAAATLDAADALEDARHEAATARALLELSTSLADLEGAEEMASKVARAVPDIIDCDRAAVFLDSGDRHGAVDGVYRVAGWVGYHEEALRYLHARTFTESSVEWATDNGIKQVFGTTDLGAVATVAAAITVNGGTIGHVTASVTTGPERLAVTPHLTDRLKGLAAQASIALSNARLVDQIRFQALHDPLTGLPNRTLILDRAGQMLARARRGDLPVAVLLIDLDGFKDVNDTLGHDVGDRLLGAVTARLTATMRAGDSVGRLGGDEFVVLFDGTSMEDGPDIVSRRLLAVLREPFVVEGATRNVLTLTASIGIAAGVRPSATELLRDADIALYEAKAAGKDCVVAFRPEMRAAVQDRHLLESDLRDALRLGQFFLVYQPIFNLASGQTVGVEALLRWRHPERGIVQPNAFIPILEDSGMISDVGRWVLEEATRQGTRWHILGHELDVSVNVSARQLETDRLIEDVRRAVTRSGFDPRSLILEITETAIMGNVTAVVPRLAELKTTGVRVAIDDFGTGYSSLAYLQQLPVDTLKIDRTFISAMSGSPESRALIRTMVQLGKSLGLETLAEGIEESGQYLQLEREQCDSGQGYLLARPLEWDAVEAFLAEHSGPAPVTP